MFLVLCAKGGRAVAIIGLIFCFCVLWLSFTANVRENAWEYGVLRAIGLDAFTVLRLYIYEALSIVLACIVLGCVAFSPMLVN